ncbi:MAG: ABC transporter permease subunit [Phycisphaeraceae bacterium]|nr:ABC transporter permease subunit [Phycisphaeraceae bacterium]
MNANPIKLLSRGLFGPVCDREIRVVSRRSSSYWVRALYVLGLAGISSLVYFAITVDIRFAGSGKASALQQLQMFAPTLGAFFAWFQFVIMCFVASTLTAGAICDERRKGSLSSLLATPLTPAQIVLGKFAGALVQIVILIAAGVPLLLAIRLFGGISPSFIVSSTCITVTTAMLHASISLAASARVRSSTMAASSGLATSVFWCFAPMILTLVLAIGSNGPRTMKLLPFSPYFSLGLETTSSLGAVNTPVFSANGWWWSVAYNGAGCALFLAIATWRFRKITLGGDVALPPKSKKKRAAALLPDGDKGASSRARDLSVWDDAMAWRELRQRVFIRPWHPWVAGIAAVALLAFAYWESGIQTIEIFFFASAVLLVVFYFQSALIASNSIAGERESRSLEVLLTTPLSARSIVRAKWIGALRRASPVFVFYLGITLVFAVLPGTFSFVVLVHLLLIAIPPVMFLIATGVWFSVVARRSPVAATLNLGLGVAIWIVFPAVFMACVAIASQIGHFPPPDEVFGIVAVWNPAPMVITAIQGADVSEASGFRWSPYRTFFDFNLWTFTLSSIAFCATYFVLTWVALRGAARSLAKRANRVR